MNRTDKYIAEVTGIVSRVALFDAMIIAVCVVLLITGVNSDVVAITAIASATVGLLWGCSAVEKKYPEFYA